MRRGVVSGLFLVLLSGICASVGVAAERANGSGQEALDCHIVAGWQQSGPIRQHTPENLFDYRDGAAEGYLQFGFAGLRGLDCKSGELTLAIDISQMADAEMAYGMLQANRDPRLPLISIGMAGQVQPQSAMFARGAQFVELAITGAAPGADELQVLLQFAKAIAARIGGSETVPEALSWFPQEGLEEARLMPESVLGLKVLKRGYVAKYKDGQAFVVQEQSAEAAAGVMLKLRERWRGTDDVALGDESFRGKVPYLDSICIFRKGRIVAGYANARTAEEAKARAAILLGKLPRS